jgi:hypothetical protein
MVFSVQSTNEATISHLKIAIIAKKEENATGLELFLTHLPTATVLRKDVDMYKCTVSCNMVQQNHNPQNY